jgi:hypothetical protein
MKKLFSAFTNCCRILLVGVFVISVGCGTGDTSLPISSEVGTLHGEWGGVYSEPNSTTKLDFTGNIVHKQGSKDFIGSMSINEEQFDVVGSVENNIVQMTFSNPTSSITYNGKHIAGRISGMFTRSTSDTAKTASATVVTSGDFSLIKFLNVPSAISMGPWLLYTQDNDNNTSNMTIRIGLDQSSSATVKVTDTTNEKTYGPFPMDVRDTLRDTIGYSSLGPQDIRQYTFSGLPTNRLFSYTIAVTANKTKAVSTVDASFRTAPSWADIQSGAVPNQVFFSYGDNRRLVTSATDHLPKVEENFIKTSGVTDSTAQSFLAHNGDASTLGKHLNTLYVARYYGWAHEWLRSANGFDSTYKENDLRYHTWLRASVPTFMSAGNHEYKANILEKSYNRSALHFYGTLMAGVYKDPADNVTLKDGTTSYDSYTYMADYGGIRIIVLNVYNCYSATDAASILSKIQTWIAGAYPGGPVILLLHPSPYGSATSDGDYWNDVAKLNADIQPLINNKKNVIVISGHTHRTARNLVNDVNYYVLGTGGADDMSSTYEAWMLPFSSGLKTPFADFAYGKFTVDYKDRKITAEIIGANSDTKALIPSGGIVDTNTWYY